MTDSGTNPTIQGWAIARGPNANEGSNFSSRRHLSQSDTTRGEEYTTNHIGQALMETFFLACFAFGLLFTLLSFVLGSVHIGGHFGHHLGHAHAHVAHVDGDQLPLLNASSLIGGLTWFGAAGYLLTRLGDWALQLRSSAPWRWAPWAGTWSLASWAWCSRGRSRWTLPITASKAPSVR